MCLVPEACCGKEILWKIRILSIPVSSYDGIQFVVPVHTGESGDDCQRSQKKGWRRVGEVEVFLSLVCVDGYLELRYKVHREGFLLFSCPDPLIYRLS